MRLFNPRLLIENMYCSLVKHPETTIHFSTSCQLQLREIVIDMQNSDYTDADSLRRLESTEMISSPLNCKILTN